MTQANEKATSLVQEITALLADYEPCDCGLNCPICLLRLLTAEYETLQREKAGNYESYCITVDALHERIKAAEARAEAAEGKIGELLQSVSARTSERDQARDAIKTLEAYYEAALASPVRDAGEPCTFTGELTPERRCSRGSWGCVTKTHEGDAGEGEQVQRCDPDNHTWRGNLPKYDARCICGAVTWAERPR